MRSWEGSADPFVDDSFLEPSPVSVNTHDWSPTVEAVPAGALAASERETDEPEHEQNHCHNPQEMYSESVESQGVVYGGVS